MDDPLCALAFRAEMQPLGARLRPILGSDIGHWDVPDMRGVLPEAWELVERGLLSPADFRDLVFTNPVSLWGARFFAGTAVEPAVARLLAA